MTEPSKPEPANRLAVAANIASIIGVPLTVILALIEKIPSSITVAIGGFTILSACLWLWLRRRGFMRRNQSNTASRSLEVTPAVGELDIWRSGHDRDGLTAQDLFRAVFSKPQFAYLRVKNCSNRHLNHLMKEIFVGGSRELRLGQWVEEYSGAFLPYDPDGVSLKVNAEKLLLLAIAFPEQADGRWYRVRSGLEKRYYAGFNAGILNNAAIVESPPMLEVRLREQDVDCVVRISIGFDSSGMPRLLNPS